MQSRRGLLGAGLGMLALPKSAKAQIPNLDARQRLAAAYREHVRGAENDDIVWRDGTRLPWSDGNDHKTFEQKLACASLADQMSLPYRKGPLIVPPALNDDPGRFRNLAFFMKMYGSDEGEVRANLEEVAWGIGDYRGALAFTRVNGVSRIMRSVVAELSRLPREFVAFLVPPAGSFNWRPIAGTGRLSPHAFGIAVDINPGTAQYWRWSGAEVWHNSIPFAIMDIFERHGFIWGGKWYHYDTMHFEYRPELID